MTWGICKKATQLGAKVVTLSGPDGYIYDPDGVATEEKIDVPGGDAGSSGRNRVQDYAEKFGVEFFPGEKPWGVKADVVMPSRHAERRAHGAGEADRGQRREVLH